MARFPPRFNWTRAVQHAEGSTVERVPPSDASESERDFEAASCVRPPDRSFLLLYALSGCREDEALAFEAHLLECDACFRDLQCMDRARALIQEFTGSASPLRDRIRKSIRGERIEGDAATPSRIPGEASGPE